MGINRFYTPALPVYTSQFVEDKSPYSEMINFEQEKLQRGEKAIALAEETNALTGSLIPGYQTKGMTPLVTDKYKQKVNKWMQDYGETSYSIPALRELSKINAEFRSDPDVKTIQQDREAASLYDRWISDPLYRREADPNINPETGDVRQLISGQGFSQYQRPTQYANILDEVNESYRQVETETSSGEPSTIWVPGPNGVDVAAMKTTTYEQRSPEKLAANRKQLVQQILNTETPGSRYLKATTSPDKWNEDYINQIISREEEKYKTRSFKDNYEYLPGQTKTSGKKKSQIQQIDMTFDLPLEPMNPGYFFDDGTNEGDLSKMSTLKVFKDTKLLNYGDNLEYYAKVKDDPEALLGLHSVNVIGEDGKERKIDAKTPLGIGSDSKMMRNALLTTRLVEDAYGTKKMFEEYFAKKEVEVTGKWEKKALEEEKEDVLKTIDKTLDKLNINENAFDNDFSESKTINAALAYGFNDPDNPFKSETELLIKGSKDFTPKENMWLKSNLKKFEKEQSKTVGFGQVIAFDPEDQAYVSEKLGGLTMDTQGRFTGEGGLSSALIGGRWVDPENPNHEFDKDEKKSIAKKDEAFFVYGMVDPRTSQYGPGMLSVTIGDKQYYIEGPNELVEPQRFSNNAFSYNLPNRAGQGDLFAVRNIGPGQQLQVVDRWNNIEGKMGPNRNDTWMSVRRNPRTEQLELNVFQGNPREMEGESPIKKPFDSKNNPQGYMTAPLGSYSSDIDDLHMRYMAARAFLEMKKKKGQDITQDLKLLNEDYNTAANGK
jgi:hypothetical protein